jgi:hypothetical protein
MNLVGKRVRVKAWGRQRGMIGTCVEYVEGHDRDGSWIDGHYIVLIGDSHYKFERGEIAKPWFGAGFLHFLLRPWR